MTDNTGFYREAALKNFTAEELKRADENYAYGANRFPTEHAEAASLIKAKGLTGHREIIGHYVDKKMPISPSAIKRIETYAQSTYVGPFGRGRK